MFPDEHKKWFVMAFSVASSSTVLKGKVFVKFGVNEIKKRLCGLQNFVRTVEHFKETGTTA